MAHDLRFALRMILTHRWFSAAVVATLAMGIGLNTMVFTLVNAVLLKPVGVPGGERLVAMTHRNPTNSEQAMRLSLPELRDYRAQASSMESLEGASDEEGVLSERGNPPQVYHLERASSGIFAMLHMHPVLGRGFLPDDDRPGAAPVLLLGYGVWKERYPASRMWRSRRACPGWGPGNARSRSSIPLSTRKRTDLRWRSRCSRRATSTPFACHCCLAAISRIQTAQPCRCLSSSAAVIEVVVFMRFRWYDDG
jgi:hypothetical protein